MRGDLDSDCYPFRPALLHRYLCNGPVDMEQGIRMVEADVSMLDIVIGLFVLVYCICGIVDDW